MLQVALHDRILERRVDGRAEHPRVGVPHAVDTDPYDKVQLDASISKLDEGPVSKPARDVREVGGTATRCRQSFQLALIAGNKFWVGRPNRLDRISMGLESLEQQPASLCHSRVSNQPRVVKGLGWSFRRRFGMERQRSTWEKQ